MIRNHDKGDETNDVVDLDELFAMRRWCYFIPLTAFIEGKGWRVSIVFEGIAGHFPTGGNGVEPWFWGDTYEEAEEAAALQNESKLQLSATDVWKIVASSMGSH